LATRYTARSAWILSLSGAAVLIAVGAVLARERSLDQRERLELAADMTGGDPRAGLGKMTSTGCTACHVVPGTPGWRSEMVRERSRIGPPLDAYLRRLYIAGVIPNTADNLIRWLKSPPSIDPRTAMPDVHLSDQDARDLAAYLYTLE
jgi:cytochrome c1